MTRSCAFARLALATGLIALVAGPATAANWTVDREASKVAFVAQQNGAPVEGVFEDWSARIRLDPEALKDAEISATVRPGTAQTGQPQIDQTLPGASWFDTANHPEATFTSQEIVSTGDNAYEARGTMTIKGTSQPFTLPFTLTIDGDTARAEAQISLARMLFGVGTDVAPPAVADPVTVTLEITATR
jgi:polyisoprenoid-binding protein YceI